MRVIKKVMGAPTTAHDGYRARNRRSLVSSTTLHAPLLLFGHHHQVRDSMDSMLQAIAAPA